LTGGREEAWTRKGFAENRGPGGDEGSSQGCRGRRGKSLQINGRKVSSWLRRGRTVRKRGRRLRKGLKAIVGKKRVSRRGKNTTQEVTLFMKKKVGPKLLTFGNSPVSFSLGKTKNKGKARRSAGREHLKRQVWRLYSTEK